MYSTFGLKETHDWILSDYTNDTYMKYVKNIKNKQN